MIEKSNDCGDDAFKINIKKEFEKAIDKLIYGGQLTDVNYLVLYSCFKGMCIQMFEENEKNKEIKSMVVNWYIENFKA